MSTYRIALELSTSMTPDDAERFAEELLAEAREHLTANESVELRSVERERPQSGQPRARAAR